MLNEQRVQEFKTLYKRHFGKELNSEEARVRAERFLRFVRVIYRSQQKTRAAATSHDLHPAT